MSTQVNTYVIWGLKLPYEQYKDLDVNQDNPYEPGFPTPLVLNDGMDGQYVIVGHCIHKTGLDGVIQGIVEIPRDKAERLAWQDDVKKFLMVMGHEAPVNQKFHWYVVSHHR